jgi:hypothetical protein
MGIGRDRTQVIDRNNFDVFTAGFDPSTQHTAADAAKSIDGKFRCHFDVPSSACPNSAPAMHRARQAGLLHPTLES